MRGHITLCQNQPRYKTNNLKFEVRNTKQNASKIKRKWDERVSSRITRNERFERLRTMI